MLLAAVLILMLSTGACPRNKTNDEVGAAQDSTAAVRSDSAPNQTESEMTDSTGQSTFGKGAEQTRPD